MKNALLLNGRTPNCRLQLKLGDLSSRKALGSAATTIWGFCNIMIGKSSRFTRFSCEPFHFPHTIHLPECEIQNERHFIEFLLRNDWVQRILGIKMDESNGFFPDIKGEIYDGSGDKIRVEVEYKAENYIQHGHAYGGCNLILSFLKSPDVRFIKGIPVWSFYEGYRGDKYVGLSLYDDIAFDFNKYNSEDTISLY